MNVLSRGLVAVILVLVVPRTAAAEPPPLPDMPAPSPEPPPPPTVSGFAIELGTGALSGPRGGSLGLGWGAKSFAIGLAIDLSYTGLSSPDSDDSDVTRSALAIGPWIRAGIVRALDGRVELDAAIDLQFLRLRASGENALTNEQEDARATGVAFRLGPGIRYWATPSIAVGYTTQLQLSTLSGPLLALSPSSTPAQPTDPFNAVEASLVGRFAVLAIF